MHSHHSEDSHATMRSMADAAINNGLKTICFTEHNDFDYPPENGKTVFLLNLREYISEAVKLREEYHDRLTINIGLEQGLMASVADRVDSYDTTGLDFIIGSSHLVNGSDPYYPEFWENRDVHESILSYYESMLDNIEACNEYDVYGHIDYIARYIPDGLEAYNEKKYADILDAILKSIISHNKGIEINTAGFRYRTGQQNPSASILKRYRELGGEIITIGSDAHSPEHVAYGFDRALDVLKDSGFKHYAVFRKRKPEFIAL